LPRTFSCGTIIAAILLTTAAMASERAAPRPVPRVDEPIKVDGHLDEPFWQKALTIPLNVEVTPAENIEALVRTDVLLAYGPRHLYVGFKAYDPDPSKIRARYSDRDRIFDDDWVAVILDTFNDERRSYDFFCNPFGIQGDIIETDGGNGGTWDAIWDSAGRITDDGYRVEMAIPFSSLRFQKSDEDQIWSFDAVRNYPRTVQHRLATFPRDRGINCYLCQAHKIIGFAGADPGRNLEFDPTLTAAYAEERDAYPDGEFHKSDSDFDPGLTVRWSMTPNLTLNGAINPDFSQVEADAAQLSLNQQFALFYPEKRPFFLEGMDYFELPINVIHTRTLVDPDWGVKLSGKVGKGALGYFTVRDRATNIIIPSSQFSQTTTLEGESYGSAFRYRRDIGESSTLGMVATDRQGDDYYSRMLGFDAVLKFTKEDTLYVNLFGSQTRYPDATAVQFGQPEDRFDGAAFDTLYMHETRKWEHYVHYVNFAENFRADLGFLPQVGYSYIDVGTLRFWYHDDPGHWYNKIRAWFGYERIEDADGNALKNLGGTLWHWQGPMEAYWLFRIYLGELGFNEREYDGDRFDWHAGFQPTGNLELMLDGGFGDTIDYEGERQARNLRLVPMIRYYAGRHMKLSLDHTYEKLEVDEGRLYRANLSDFRADYQINRRMLFRAILQHADFRFNEEFYAEARYQDLLSQLLFSYKINPQTALYLGYSDNYLGDDIVDLTQMERTFFFKVGYAWVM
jgi:hypothetical protein